MTEAKKKGIVPTSLRRPRWQAALRPEGFSRTRLITAVRQLDTRFWITIGDRSVSRFVDGCIVDQASAEALEAYCVSGPLGHSARAWP